MKLFHRSSKKGFAMALIQAVFAVLILAAVVIVLSNSFDKFPQVNLLPAKLANVTTEKILHEQYVRGKLRATVAEFDAEFLTGKNAKTFQKPIGTTLDSSCFVKEYRLLLSDLCRGYVQKAYLDSVDSWVSTGIKSHDFDLQFLTNENNKKILLATQFSPIRNVVGHTKEGGFKKLDESSFLKMPEGNVEKAYRYNDQVLFEAPLSDNILTVLRLDAEYAEIKRIAGNFTSTKANKFGNREDWVNYLNSNTTVDGEIVFQRELVARELKAHVGEVFPYIAERAKFTEVELSAYSATFSFLALRVELHFTY